MKSTLMEMIKTETTTAMKAKNKDRLRVLRMLSANIKQVMVDERKESLTDGEVTAILVKMVKQRKDSVTQYQAGNRQDLADVELYEITVLDEFLPKQLTEQEIEARIDAVIATFETKPTAKEMGMIMGKLSDLRGQADMGVVSTIVRKKIQ